MLTVVAPASMAACDDLAEEVDLGPRGVLGAELDVGAVPLARWTLVDGPFDDLRVVILQLVLAVDGRRGQEDVDPRLSGRYWSGFQAPVDVALVAAGEAADRRAGDLGGDGPDGLEVADARRSGTRPR